MPTRSSSTRVLPVNRDACPIRVPRSGILRAQMPPIKDRVSVELVEALAAEMSQASPSFPRDEFVRLATSGLEELELMERVSHVGDALAACLPTPFTEGASVLDRALDSESLTGWMALSCGEWVATCGIDSPDIALPLLARLTGRFSSEFALRPFIERHPETTHAQLVAWTTHTDEHVRRLVSEGTRPRLPWASRLRDLLADPRPNIDLLDRLVGDESAYVARSVANHLNDISKDHPELALSTAERWQRDGADWIVRHGLRTLLKQGNPRALALVGYAVDVAVELHDLRVTPEQVEIGGTVELTFALIARESPARVMIDYRIHHAGATARRSPKVFKLTTCTLAAGERRVFTRRHAFRVLSVRQIHAGEHLVDVQVNGRVLGSVAVQVGR